MAFTAERNMPLLENLRREHLEAFFNSLAARGNAPATIRNRQASLRSFFNWQVEYDLRKEHPMARIKLERIPEQVQPHYDEKQLRAVLAAIPIGKPKKKSGRPDYTAQRDRCLILFLLDTGLRAAELCSIRLGDVDRQARRVLITGKGGKQRRVSYSPEVAAELFRYLNKRASGRTLDRAALAAPTAPLFCTRSGDPLDVSGLRMALQRRFEAGGVPWKGIHGFRRSFAIAFLQDGGNPTDLRELAGWSSWSMLSKYTKAAAAEQAHAAHQEHSPAARLLAKGRKG
jgi:site-specific recombinase XerD